MKTLTQPLSAMSFYEREKRGIKYVTNKCGRDFIYYALNYYLPDTFNTVKCNPQDMDRLFILGIPVPSLLAWTQIQFVHTARFLKQHNLALSINDRNINNFYDFIKAILFSSKDITTAISSIEKSIDINEVVGIDISLGLFGLYDHVLFVYGYDKENLYVVDTHKVQQLEYSNIDNNPFFFKLPKDVLQNRWTRFGRVWKIIPIKRS